MPPTAVAGGSYRFLLELVGQTSSSDNALVAFGQQRCFTFVDLVPVDVGVLDHLVPDQIPDQYVQNGLMSRVATLELALTRRDYAEAFNVMAYIIGHLIARTPEHAAAGGGTPGRDRRLRRAARPRFPRRDRGVRQRRT